MGRIRHNINPYVAITIYKAMIHRIMFYCNNILLDLCTNQNTKFENLQSRAKKIIPNEEATCSWKPIEYFRKMYCAQEVFKCINNLAPLSSITTF